MERIRYGVMLVQPKEWVFVFFLLVPLWAGLLLIMPMDGWVGWWWCVMVCVWGLCV